VCNQIGETFDEIKSQHGCTGPPLYGVELKIVSTDNRTLQIDEEGEVLIRYDTTNDIKPLQSFSAY